MNNFDELKQSGTAVSDSIAAGRGGKDLLSHDPRAMLIVFMAFIVFVVSVDKYNIVQLALFSSFPIFLITAARINAIPLLKKFLVVSPFIIMLGIFNPFLDTRTFHVLPGGWQLTGGMFSFAVILGKGFLSFVSAMILTSRVSFYELCGAMSKMRVPKVFVVQLLFLYRYIFVLAGEAHSMQQARDLRAFTAWGRGIGVSSRMLGTLFLRTLDRSQRIYRSMTARGFDGEIILRDDARFSWKDTVFVIVSLGMFAGLRALG